MLHIWPPGLMHGQAGDKNIDSNCALFLHPGEVGHFDDAAVVLVDEEAVGIVGVCDVDIDRLAAGLKLPEVGQARGGGHQRDCDCSTLVGVLAVSDIALGLGRGEQWGLKAGMLGAALFPMVLILCLLLSRRFQKTA